MPHSHRWNILVSLALATSACAEDPATPTPFTTIAATDPTSRALGVTSWDIAGDAERHVIGRDDTGVSVIEALITRDLETPDTRVHIEVLGSDAASFDLLESGEVIADRELPVAGLLFDDLGHHTMPLGELTIRSGNFLSGEVWLDWSLFGYGGYRDVGRVYPGMLRSDDSHAWRSNPRVYTCWLNWLSPSRSDLRARINYAIAADSWGWCHWAIKIE